MSDHTQLNVDLVFTSELWHAVPALEPLVTQAATAAYEQACHHSDCTGAHEVVFNLSDDATVKDLNLRFRGKDQPTNILSFPYEDDFPELHETPKPLGDIILAFETVSREADDQEKTLSHHIAHLCVHGVLHLFGYDHIVTTEAEEMEELERGVLATLHIPSPYTDGE